MPEAKKIEIIARGVVRHGHWILLCRNLDKGYYYLPGGHVEPGEAAADALVREMQEEAGVTVPVGACLLVNESRFEQGGKARHEINLVFHVEPPHPPHPAGGDSPVFCEAPEPVRSLEEHIGFEWVDMAALSDTDLRPTVIRAWLVSGGDLGDTTRPGWISTHE